MPDPRFKAPNPRQAAKRRAAVAAFLGGGAGDIADPNAPTAVERARAAYDAETGEFNPNFLNSLLKARPRDVKNWLVSMVRGAAANPMSVVGVPGRAAMTKEMQRMARLRAYPAQRAAYDAERMRDVNRFLAEKRSAFSTNLEPPPARTTPRREYVIEQRGRGVDVFDALEMPPEQISLEQARAAGLLGPEAAPLPASYRFTRRGPGIDVFEQ